jgi:nucleotide-binding universal stress UspA family protein
MSEARDILIDSGISDEAVHIYIHDREEGIARDIIGESSRDYSAVIVGRNGLNKINEFVLGSVANKLIERLVNIPIIMVGGRPNPAKILFALDESKGAMQAVDYVGKILNGSASEVTLFHVVRDFSIFKCKFEAVINLTHEKKGLQGGKLAIGHVFEVARTRLIDSGFDPKRITTKLIERGSSRAGAIIEEARKGGDGTIVVGRRGLSKIYEFSMGRVSNKVIQMAKNQAVWMVP